MKKSARIAAAGAAAVLTAAVGILGAASASADNRDMGDNREFGTDGTRVTSVEDNWEWGDNREFGADGTRVTSVQDNRDF